MKKPVLISILTSLSILVMGTSAFATTRSLDRELKDLDVKDKIPSSRLSERIYAVQERITPLKFRPELNFGIAQNYGGSGFLETNQLYLEIL